MLPTPDDEPKDDGKNTGNLRQRCDDEDAYAVAPRPRQAKEKLSVRPPPLWRGAAQPNKAEE